jgi:ECF sigma factor
VTGRLWTSCSRSSTAICTGRPSGSCAPKSPGHTLQVTGPVHEAYLRLVDQDVQWQSRAHFFGVAGKAMRSILVDHARAHKAAKRGEAGSS